MGLRGRFRSWPDPLDTLVKLCSLCYGGPMCAGPPGIVFMRWISSVVFMLAGGSCFAAANDTPAAASQPALPVHEAAAPLEDKHGSLLDGFVLRPAALTEPIVTDRPDFTESPETVPRGHVQLETGYTFTYDSELDRRTTSQTFPEALLRVGVTERFELRFGWVGYEFVTERFPSESRAGRHITVSDSYDGGRDLYLGFKQKFFDQQGLRPNFAIIPAINAPSGSAAFSSGDVDPEIKLAWGYDLTERVALSGNLNFAAPTEEAGRFFQASNSVSLAFALFDGVGAYTEYFGFYPNTRDGDCAHSLNGGLTWQLTDNLQLDWRAGFGLNEEADDFFTGFGLSVRF